MSSLGLLVRGEGSRPLPMLTAETSPVLLLAAAAVGERMVVAVTPAPAGAAPGRGAIAFS